MRKLDARIRLSRVGQRAAAHGIEGAALTRVTIDQRLHEGFRAWVQLEAARSATSDVLGLRGEDVTIELEHEPLIGRIHGLVDQVRLSVSEDASMERFELGVVSSAERLRHSRRHRIFHDRTVEQIVAEVFAAHPEIEPPVHATEEGRERREYTVQYGESDWDFVRRLLAEGGMVLVSDPSSARSLVTSDTTRENVGRFTLPFRSNAGLEQAASPAIRQITLETRLVPDGVVVRAFDERKPLHALEGRAARAAGTLAAPPPGAGAGAGREWFEFEQHAFDSASSASARAVRVHEELTRDEERVSCASTAALPVGAQLVVTGVPSDLGDSLLVVAAHTEIAFPKEEGPARHETSLVAMPNRRYRAPRIPKPRIHGTQTAMVRTAGNEEIDVDAEGRIEIEFPWDRRDARAAGALRRVRLAHAWAGAGFGMGAIPRVGDEVVVSFIDGDPDEPLVVGRVHNGAAPGPLKLPEERAHTVWRTQSTPGGGGFNEIRLIDDAGAELLDIHAQRDMRKSVGRDRQTKVARHDVKKVDGDKQTVVAGDKQEIVKQDEMCCVGVDLEHLVGGAMTVDAKSWTLTAGERTDMIKGTWSSFAAKHQFLDGGFSILTAKLSVVASESILLQVGGTVISMTPGKILLSTGGASITLDAGTITQIASLIDLNP